MKFFKWVLCLFLFFACTGYPAKAQEIHPGMCQMSTIYEDQMHKIADFEKGAFKGRFALLNGQCEGHISYMAIITYYHGGVKTTFLDDERIQKMKHVQVGEVLANQNGGVYLKIIFSQWYGLDGQGKVVASAEDKKSVGNTDISLYVEGIRTIYGSLVKNKPDGMHGSMDEMKLEAKEWSLPGFKIVVDEEWADYVRPDVNFVMSERGDA